MRFALRIKKIKFALGKCYILDNENFTNWTVAKNICVNKYSAELVAIEDEEEQDFIYG